MRQCALLAPLPKSSWSPQFPRKSGNKLAAKKEDRGQQKTMPMSLFPTIKGPGGRRMETLRRYSFIDMARLLEVDSDVVFWTTQAETVLVTDDDRTFPYKPDFQVEHKDGSRSVIRIIAGRNGVSVPPKNREAAALHYEEQGIRFRGMTEDEVSSHPYLRDACLILAHRCLDWPDEALFVLAQGNEQTMGDAHETLGGTEQAWFWLITLIGLGHIEVPFGMPLSRKTEILSISLKGYEQ